MTYYFHWLDGRKTEMIGESVEDAFTSAGYGAGAIRALDFYTVDDDSYVYNSGNSEWKSKDS